MREWLEIISGGAYFSLAAFSHFAQELFPIITFIAATTGAILGCHGVYILINNRIHRLHNKIHHLPYSGDY